MVYEGGREEAVVVWLRRGRWYVGVGIWNKNGNK